MNLAGICIFTLFVASLAAPHPPLQNITITVPQGTSNHSDPHLLCTPADGYDVALFIFANYAAHVATIVTLPGETLGSILLTMIFALIYPMTGIQKCIRLLGKHTLLRRDQSPLNNALRAGALCEVVRTADWKPEHGNKIYNAKATGLPAPQERQDLNADSRTDIELQRIDNQAVEPAHQSSTTDTTPDLQEISAGEETGPAETRSNTEQIDAIEPHLDDNRPTTSNERTQFACFIDEIDSFDAAKNTLEFRGRAIHGRCSIPPGYALSIVPANVIVHPLSEISNSEHSSDLSSSYNILGILAAIFQLFYGSFTLYRTRGDQIERYGFAAFGLTVTPYVVMSFINLLTLLVTPSYSKLYLVKSSVMEEAKLREAFFEGEVGKIEEETLASKSHERSIRLIAWITQIRTDLLRIFVPIMPKNDNITSGAIEFRTHGASAAKFTGVRAESQAIWDISVYNPTKNRQNEFEHSSIRLSVTIPASPVIRPAYWLRQLQKWLFIVLSMFISALSLVIIGCLSHFESAGGGEFKEHIMTLWLFMGVLYSALFIMTFDLVFYRILSDRPLFSRGGTIFIWELVIVCKELLEYGSCVRLF